MKPRASTLLRTLATLAVLGAVIAGAILFRPDGGGGIATATPTGDAASVVVTAVETRGFERSLAVAGNLEPARFAVVSARIPGVLDEILVDEGDPVVAEETVLFRTDSLKLGKALELSRENEVVAAAALRERVAYLAQIEADHHAARLDVERFRRLTAKGAATARQLEQQESRFAMAAAGVEHARALLDLAKAQAAQATTATAIARKDLDDATVLAPIGGLVTRRIREPGEDAGAGKPVLRIEDHSVLEVSVYLPEEAYDLVRPGETKLRLRLGAKDLGDVTASWRSPTVDIRLRTFEVKAILDRPEPDVVPGRLVDAEVVLTSVRGTGVPTGAIVRRRQGTCVFVVRDGKARLVPVTTGLETGGWTLVQADGLADGDPVVTVGQDRLDDGDVVRVVDGER